MRLIVVLVGGVLVVGIVTARLVGESPAPASRSAAIVDRPIDSSHQLQLPWGSYSHWIQP